MNNNKINKIYLRLYVLHLVAERSSHRSGQKNGIFKKISQNSLENTSAGVSFLTKLLAALKKETLVQVFSCEV